MMKKTMMVLSVLGVSCLSFPVFGQDTTSASSSVPITATAPAVQLIPALRIFRDQSNAKLHYLGRHNSMDAWVAFLEGDVMQIIYTTPDGKGLLMNGFLFDESAKEITRDLLGNFFDENPDMMDRYIEGVANQASVNEGDSSEESATARPQTPAEQFWQDLDASAFVEFGPSSAPLSYVFVDPRCPHCKSYWKKMRPHVEAGKVRLRLVLLGAIREDSEALSATIFGADNPQQAWLDVVDGLLQVDNAIAPESFSRIRDNGDLMDKWRVQSTPFSVYRSKEGNVRMLRGDIPDLDVFFNDIGA